MQMLWCYIMLWPAWWYDDDLVHKDVMNNAQGCYEQCGGIVPWMRNNAGYNTLNDEWWMMNDDDYEAWATKCLCCNVFMNVLMFLMLLMLLYESTLYAKWRCCYKMFNDTWQKFSNIVHGFAYRVYGSPLVSNILQID